MPEEVEGTNPTLKYWGGEYFGSLMKLLIVIM